MIPRSLACLFFAALVVPLAAIHATDAPGKSLLPALRSAAAAEASALPAAEAVERGRALYQSVGCVACHSPEKALPGSLPLGPLAEKYSLASLTAFLKDPLAARPGGRMPDSHLEHAEAEGVTYGEGLMLPLEQTYTDEQLASVLNFIGQRWHNWKQPIAAEAIARVRQETADRKTPWTHEELKTLGKPKPGQ